MASLEGRDGFFYLIDPDMHMFHALSEESAGQLAELSGTLAALGTTLIYLPLPTKSLAMPDQLPRQAADFGFDPALATTHYLETLRLLRDNEVLTADVRSALQVDPAEPPSFFRTDYRLTAAGARRASRAIADAMEASAGFANLPKAQFETGKVGKATLPSVMRSALQRHCMITLPPVETETYATTRLQAAQGTTDNTIFSGSTTSGRVAVVGTEHAGDPSANLSGFLSEYSGLDVVEYAVPGGGSFAAISSYLTSSEFQEARPAYLVWINPVQNNLAQFGDQPMRELIAAAGTSCRVALPLLSNGQSNSVIADLSGLDPRQPYTLFLDAEGTDAAVAQFDFLSAAGLIRTKSIHRHPDQQKTGRFFMPLSGLWPEGAQTVEILLDAPIGDTARLTACFD